jgi:hypothetical protein
MSVKLNRPPKPEESQKDSNINGKTIPYPGFEPGTSGLAVGSHNHCTIWVGLIHHKIITLKHEMQLVEYTNFLLFIRRRWMTAKSILFFEKLSQICVNSLNTYLTIKC